MHADDPQVDPAVWSIDLLASKLVSTRIPEDEARIVRAALGIDDRLGLLPAHREIAESLGAPPTEIAGAIRRARDRWSKHRWVAPLRASVATLVAKYGGIMTVRELADALAANRGSTETGEARLRLAGAVAAAALEMESTREEPRYRLHRRDSPSGTVVALVLATEAWTRRSPRRLRRAPSGFGNSARWRTKSPVPTRSFRPFA